MSELGIDLAKLRAMLRKQSRQTIYSMLDEAIGLLSKAKLDQLVVRYMHAPSVRMGAPIAKVSSGLLAETEAFATASRRGDYFETFNVNSKNYTEQSNGTTAWIAECNRLLDQCVARAKGRRGQAEILAAFDILFDLIDQAVSCDLDIVFFADEGGLWSFGIDWSTAFVAWVTCVTRVVVDDADFETRVADVLERFGRGEPRMSLEAARGIKNAAEAAERPTRAKRKS